MVKSKMIDSDGTFSWSSPSLSSLFSPWYAEHLGLILPASGNTTVAQWAKNTLRIQSYIFTYSSLLKLHGNNKLLKEVDALLGNEALLKLHLSTLAPVFKDKEKRNWFEEVIDNNFKLWEVNMR